MGAAAVAKFFDREIIRSNDQQTVLHDYSADWNQRAADKEAEKLGSWDRARATYDAWDDACGPVCGGFGAFLGGLGGDVVIDGVVEGGGFVKDKIDQGIHSAAE
jgi:hypothetical protein